MLAPEPGYRADGNCRACMVEIEGERVLAASCIRQPKAGMKVVTASERAKARQMVFELLVSDQPPREGRTIRIRGLGLGRPPDGRRAPVSRRGPVR